MSHTLISRRWTRLGVVAATLLAGTSLASAEVTYERLLNPEPENWLMNHRTFDSNRYSPLDEINTGNAGDLKIALPSRSLPRRRSSSAAACRARRSSTTGSCTWSTASAASIAST